MKIFRIILAGLIIISSLLFIYYLFSSFGNPSYLDEGKNFLYLSISVFIILKTIDAISENGIQREEKKNKK